MLIRGISGGFRELRVLTAITHGVHTVHRVAHILFINARRSAEHSRTLG
jgi:hypothetical protein